MVFSSTIFIFAFLPVTLAGYYLLGRRFKNAFLLAASILFYAWGEPVFVFVMLGSVLVNHVFALLIDRQRARGRVYLTLMVIFNLSLFFVYKYLNFAIENINAFAGLFGMRPLPQTHMTLPIGISFFTFQAMSYVFDVYRERGRVQKNPMNTALYISLFPQLIAGPIVRYETVAEEINDRRETLEDFARGVRRFTIGLGKKVILANSVAVVADWAFVTAGPMRLSVLGAWLGAVSYTLQIYFDFSGYSDMAIGLGLMFGFHFEENFNYPYIASSVSEFWRRWHISLGSWFRDYVYFPMGGSRVNSRARLIGNLFVVWLLTGVWHGAAWHFIAWGLMYFVLITFEKLTGWPRKLRRPWQRGIYRLFTLLAVVLGWVIFRADDMGTALRYIGCMFGALGNAAADAVSLLQLERSGALLLMATVFSVPFLPWLRGRLDRLPDRMAAVKEICVGAAYFAVLLLSIAITVTSTYNPFIYFNF